MKILYWIIGYLACFLSVYIAAWTYGNLYTFSVISPHQGGVVVTQHSQLLFLFIPALLLFGIGIFIIAQAIDM